jgi:phospholipid-transporting ATPase
VHLLLSPLQTLYEQFCKKANLYFLIIALLCFTPLSPKSPAPAIAPLIFVLAVTAVKEAAEDYKRYKVDIEINGTLVTVYRYDQWLEIAWAKVQAGDFVKVLSEAFFPADLVLLQSSANQGLCSIETANLDGETNLKAKQAVPATYELPCGDDGLDYPSHFQGILESDPPNDKMDQNSWNGNFKQLQNTKGDVQDTVPLGFTQLLLRGCRLRNTKWIIGMVAFTGRDTKLMLQAKSKDVKRSNLDTAVDKCIYIIWAFQACVCAAGAIGQSIWLKGSGGTVWYLEWSTYSIPTYAFLSYFTYLVLMDILIPISLYVSMELVKFGQALFISNDAQMKYTSVSEYGEKTVIKSAARTSNLNEELGQISYIFSDKVRVDGQHCSMLVEFRSCSHFSLLSLALSADRYAHP